MAQTIRDIQKDIRKWGEEGVGVLVRQTVLGLRRDTPKDTEFASVNWMATINKLFRGTNGTKEDAKRGRVRKQAQISAIATVRREFKFGKGQRVHIVNNTPYIDVLDQGGPFTTPRNFVDPSATKSAKEAELIMNVRERRRRPVRVVNK